MPSNKNTYTSVGGIILIRQNEKNSRLIELDFDWLIASHNPRLPPKIHPLLGCI